MAVKYRPDRAGIRAMLNSGEVAALVADRAASVAANVPQQLVDHGRVDIPVDTAAYTTDRPAVSVALAHPAGIAVEAKYGILARAAAAAGLEVNAR